MVAAFYSVVPKLNREFQISIKTLSKYRLSIPQYSPTFWNVLWSQCNIKSQSYYYAHANSFKKKGHYFEIWQWNFPTISLKILMTKCTEYTEKMKPEFCGLNKSKFQHFHIENIVDVVCLQIFWKFLESTVR